MPKISDAGASGGGQLKVPANAYVREDGVITAPPAGVGALLAANNLSDVASESAALANLGALPEAGGSMSGPIAMGGNAVTGASALAVSGLDGATAAPQRLVGGTAGGPPTAGTFAVGDIETDAYGTAWVNTSSGWQMLGAETLRDTYLRSSAIIGETVSRSSMLNTGILLTSGYLYLAAVALPQGAVVGHLDFASSTGSTSPTHWWFGLFDSNRNMLAVTADQTTTGWGSTVYQPLAIAETAAGAASSFTTTYTGLYYIGVMMAAGTPVTLVGGGQASSAISAQAPVLTGTSNTGQATPPSFPFQANSISAAGNVIYGAVTT